MNSIQAQMPTASSLFSIYASISAFFMLLRSIFNEFIPKPIRDYLYSLLSHLFKHRSDKLTLVIEENNSNGIGRNEVYDAAEVYLSAKITTPTTDRLKISKGPKDKSLTVRFERGEKIDDSYDGIDLHWSFVCLESEKRRRSEDDDSGSGVSVYETRFFELTLEKEYKDKVINSYLPYILSKSKSIKDEERTLKLHTLGNGYRFSGGSVYWDSINLEHPSTFETLAMDPDLKSDIIDDLDRFVRRKEFYRRVGRSWKRGYLLHGPPGTGKSSLVAAMANHLRFDIYDLQLGSLMRDSDLRRLLLATANRSILVIEDIDCSVEINDRHKSSKSSENGKSSHKLPEVQFTLSGLLNFIDGLWSCCGDERIIVFTTNHKEKLDPALLRPGRMDMHIHMSYLTIPAFKILATNYLGIKDGNQRRLFGEIEKLIETTNVTPAQVAEELVRTEDVEKALEGVLKLLKKKKEMVQSEEEIVGSEEEMVKAEGVNGTTDELHGTQNGW